MITGPSPSPPPNARGAALPCHGRSAVPDPHAIELPAVPSSHRHYEQLAREAGFRRVAGIDEAGRGPLAGPVVAAAALLPAGLVLPGLDDSKALTERTREHLFQALCDTPGVVFGIAWASPLEIDRWNILRATHEAMRRAWRALRPPADFVFIDGRPVPDFPCPSRAVVKGDHLAACISAASILAKVTRDRMMENLHRQYPRFGFDSHKGYGTPAHLDAIRRFGPCPEHRRSFRPVAEALPGALRQQELF